jgi:hypothetical protein
MIHVSLAGQRDIKCQSGDGIKAVSNRSSEGTVQTPVELNHCFIQFGNLKWRTTEPVINEPFNQIAF